MNHAFSYTVSQIELYNWGGFSGLHQADIHPDGSAIIGSSGSGKTTVVDAVMTLLVARPSYNLASTGTEKGDRDLTSYIRGVSGTAQVARTGKTISAICLRCQPVAALDQKVTDLFGSSQNLSADGSPLVLAVIFWFDGNSNQAADRKNLWLVSSGDTSLAHWLTIFDDGGSRGIKQYAKTHTDLIVFDDKRSYLSHIQQLFEVSDSAFKLLNRAVGVKQLHSVNEIFRELVLDDRSLFDEAARNIEQFSDLTNIKNTLDIAKKQYKSLLPIKALWQQYQHNQQQVNERQQMIDMLPCWYAYHAYHLWQQKIDGYQVEYHTDAHQHEELQQQYERSKQQFQALQTRYLQAGGSNVETLKSQISQQTSHLQKINRQWQDYQILCDNLVWQTADNEQDLANQQQVAKAQQTELGQAIKRLEDQRLTLGVTHKQLSDELATLNQQLTQAKQQKSNIPPEFEAFRHRLADHLSCDVEDVPFVAQMVEVKSEHAQWQGAIERALGSHRLRLLVPKPMIKEALAWVNHRHNHLHVRLYRANERDVTFFDDSFVHFLNIKSHPLTDALMTLLSSLDKHCVDDVMMLERTRHAMTQEGLMSSKEGWYDKQDQKALNQQWLTGFDNQMLLKRLMASIDELQVKIAPLDDKIKAITDNIQTQTAKMNLMSRLAQIDFADIDVNGAEQQLQDLQQRYDALTAPDSELAKLKQQQESLNETLQQLQTQINQHMVTQMQLNEQIAQCQSHQKAAEATLDRHQAIDRAMGELPMLLDTLMAQPIMQVLTEYLPKRTLIAEQLSQNEKDDVTALHKSLGDMKGALGDIRQKIINQMNAAKNIDTGELAEAGNELIDIEAYLTRLAYLTEEGLPKQEKRFVEYLTLSSTESLTQLISDVKMQLDEIKVRIDGLNQVLHKVDFGQNTYLQLATTPVMHQSLREFDKLYKQVNTYSLSIKTPDHEAHYQALCRLIEHLTEAIDKRHTQAAKSLLDPRYRLEFSIQILSRDQNQLLESRTGSQHGSGGEKEIIASYILTASLSYALNPKGYAAPKFATIIIDEAFSKSSQAVGGRIVKAIFAFGLHPIFVTPNKEMQLLRHHTNSAVLVHKRGVEATLSNWSWQKIDAFAQRQVIAPTMSAS